MLKIAINGFGRIGRNFLRSVLLDPEASKKIEVVAINIGPAKIDMIAHMFKYDSLMGPFPGSVKLEDHTLIISGFSIPIITELDPSNIKWASYTVDWVVEATGKFTWRKGAQRHCDAGAKYVLITAPAQEEDVTIIPGVNDVDFDPQRHCIVALGSCTTNAFMPMVKVLNDTFGVNNGLMTTIHAYTNTQVLLDVNSKDLRRSRAAAINVIPTSTGAAKLIGKIIPELQGCIRAMAIRVPIPKVSLIEFSFIAEKPLSTEKINEAFIDAAQKKPLKGIIGVTDHELVSSDFSGNEYSVTIDTKLTDVCGDMGKVFGWYDNEWAFSVRLKDFLLSTM